VTHDPNELPEGAEDPELASLDARLQAARRAEAERTAEPKPVMGTGTGSKQGQRVLSVLLGYPLGGGIIGWLLDGWLHTRPWIMLVLLFLGFAAACREVFQISKERPE
jgi:ATP synthase protein I